MAFIKDWEGLSLEEKESMISPFIEEIKKKMINSSSTSIAIEYEWSKDDTVRRIVGETITIDINY